MCVVKWMRGNGGGFDQIILYECIKFSNNKLCVYIYTYIFLYLNKCSLHIGSEYYVSIFIYIFILITHQFHLFSQNVAKVNILPFF